MGDIITNYILSQGLNAPGTVYSDERQDTYQNDPLKNAAARLEESYGKRETGVGYNLTPLGKSEKYTDIGLRPSVQLLKAQQNGSLDKIMSENQSAFSKFKNALEQAVVSEVGLGTAVGISDLFDAIGQKIFELDKDYSNPVTKKLEEWQELFNNNVAPIYTDPNIDISNGGLLDAGWYASNIPSIMSSLTLLIPSTGATKGLKYLGKGAKRLGSTTAKWANRANKLEDAASAEKKFAGLKEFMTLSTGTRESLGTFAEVGTTAMFSRTMENYQEARQTYDDMYEHASESLSKMSDEEYAEFLRRNDGFLGDADTSNRDEVAKAVAKNAADRTFAMDYANTGFDILQLYALRNMAFRGFRSLPNRAAIRRAHLNSIKYPGMNDADIAAQRLKMSFWDKTKEKVGDKLYGSSLAIKAQLSEGVEEAVNYIAQQDGLNLGHVMLGEVDNTAFKRRLAEYVKAPGLWESAFWGTVGGIVFQELGSGFNRAANAISTYNKYKENAKTKEKVEKPTWKELWEAPEIKRRKADIESRLGDLNNYLDELKQIKDDKNPFADGAEVTSETERNLLKEKAYNKMLNRMTLRALDSGNFDLLKEYLSSDEIKKVITDTGAITEEQATQYQQDAIRNMEAIEKQYDINLRTLNNLTKRINANRKEPIPVEYIQLIARNNIEHQLQIKDFESQLAAWEIDGNEKQEAFKKKLDPDVNYKSAVRLVLLSNTLGDYENQRRQLLANKEFVNSLLGQQELDFINNQINAIRDIIYNIEPKNAVGNLLFAIEHSLNYEINEKGQAYHNNRNQEYIKFRTNITKLERAQDAKTLKKIDEYLTSLDTRFAGATTNETTRLRLLDDNLRRAYDIRKGLIQVSKELHDTFFEIADLQLAIEIERRQLKLTEDEVLNEVNAYHNFLNEARKKAIDTSRETLKGLAKTYGSDAVRAAFARRYAGNQVEDTYFGEDEKARADAKIFNDALDILNIDAAANRNLALYIDSLLALNDDIVAAQGENTSTSEEPISELQNQQMDNTTQQTPEAVTNDLEQKKQAIPQTETPSQEQSLTLTNGDNVYGRLIPNPDREGTYNLELVENNPDAIKYLNDEDFYTKSGVSLTDDFIVKELPVVTRNKDGSLRPIKKGLIVKASEDNIIEEEEKVEEETNQTSPTGGLTETPTSTSEYIPNQVQSSAEIASGNAAEDIRKEVSNALLKQSSINWEDLRDRIIKKYVPAEDNDNTEHLINIAIRSWQKIYERKQKGKSNPVDDALVLTSSMTERSKNKNIVKDFEKAVDKLVKKYIKDVAADEIDGVYYIRVEDLLRYCNEVSETQTTAQLLYNNLVDYISKSDKYVIIDTNLNDAINNATQNARTRLEQVTNRKNLYGINFEGLLSELEELGATEELEKIYDAFENLNIGDKIKYEASNHGVVFSINGVTIGSLPLPRIGDNGERWQWNDGWKTDVLNNKGNIISSFKNLIKHWILDTDNPDVKELNDIIIEAAFGKNNKKPSRLNALAKKLAKNKEFIKAKQDGFTNKDTDDVTLLKGLAKIWGYTRQVNGSNEKKTKALRELSVNKWFENEVSPSFEMVEVLYANKEGNVIVGAMNEGEIIQTDEKDALPTNKGIGEKHKKAVRIAAASAVGKLTVAGKGVEGNTTLDYSGFRGAIGYGNTVVVIPAKSGRHAFVHAFPQPLGSNQFGGKIKQVINAVFDELDRIGKGETIDEVYTNLEKFVNYLVNKKGSNITPLFRILGEGLTTFVDGTTKEKLGFKLKYTRRNDDGTYTNHDCIITYKGKRNDGTIYKRDGLAAYVNRSWITYDDTTKAINSIKDFLKQWATFHIGFDFINSDNNTKMYLNSLAKRNKDNGKFEINIGEKTFTFDSFNDFILNNDNNVVSVTTEPASDGTNFRKGSSIGNQLAKQVLRVKLEQDSTRPVEESNNESAESKQTTVDKVLDILADKQHKGDIGKRVAKLILGEKVKNVKINNIIFDIFPKNIKFVSQNIGDIARTNVGNNTETINGTNGITIEGRQVLIGNEWFNLLNGTIAQREEAIRKLAHEQLHLILHSSDNEKYIEQIREIFDEFAAKNTNEALNQYLYNNTPEQKNRYWTDGKLNVRGLEEFLVETLTSKELAEALNSIQVEEKVDDKTVKKSLLQKIMERLAKMFGWSIEEGSLYEKEFNLLRDIFEDFKQEELSTKTATQLEFNFDELVTEQNLSQEENIEQEETIDTGMKFEDDDLFASSIVENESIYSSVSTYVDTLPLEQQISMLDKINKGEVQTKCK